MLEGTSSLQDNKNIAANCKLGVKSAVRHQTVRQLERLTLMLIVLREAELVVELCANLIKQLIEAAIALGNAPHATVRVHGHGG